MPMSELVGNIGPVATIVLADDHAIVRYVLLAFAGIALFVGSLVIFNTCR